MTRRQIPLPKDGPGYLQSLSLQPNKVPSFAEYPYAVAAVRHLRHLKFHPGVTFFVGENGSGKSTLLEAIAVKLHLNAEGGTRNFGFSTRETHSILHEAISLNRSFDRFTDSFFLRAESFYNVASYVDDVANPINYGGKSLHAQSHGESFLALLEHRLGADGVYLFDEPEAALSPQRQLSVLTLFQRLVRLNSQLIIATHSPILLAYPQALIYEFSESGIHERSYCDTEPFRITQNFLNNRDRILDLLLRDED